MGGDNLKRGSGCVFIFSLRNAEGFDSLARLYWRSFLTQDTIEDDLEQMLQSSMLSTDALLDTVSDITVHYDEDMGERFEDIMDDAFRFLREMLDEFSLFVKWNVRQPFRVKKVKLIDRGSVAIIIEER